MRDSIRKAIYIGTLLTCIGGLSGCLNVATTGAQVVYNHRNLKRDFDDHLITMRTFQALYVDDDRFKNTHIAFSTFHGEVLLVGQVSKKWQRTQAERIVRNIPDVKKIYNLIVVATPSSVMTHMRDTWITSKVSARLISSDDIDATQIKVVTENGIVYLMGIVPPHEAVAAMSLASATDGVNRVVNVFSYIHIDKKLS
jgi:osmotically-inducible protein OsmY